ncbi:flagellar basal body P-ring formation chaperone FlgA [Halorhodospira halophila]|nr:flagellar basal body P-ring formation chaperone FlgA [Halorhodospira halophila]
MNQPAGTAHARRPRGGVPPSPGWRLGVVLLALSLWTPAATVEANTQSPDAIREAAESFLREELIGEYDEVAVEARGVDQRLNLRACDEGDLEAFIPRGRSPQQTSTVGVSCGGEAPWTVYVRMETTLKTEMVVATRNLRRGQRVSAGDLRTATRDARRIRGEFYRDPAPLIGQAVRRSLREGAAITGNHVQPPRLVERNDRVTITAGNGGAIQISSRGRALEHGQEGERIRVENLDSGREIQARVVGEGQVRVGD